MTRGEFCVGITFNPSSNNEVDEIKRKAADLIDAVDAITDGSQHGEAAGAERTRLKALARTDIESAAMWAVKAATKTEPNTGAGE